MLTKHATFEVIEAKIAHRGDRLLRTSHKHIFDYDPRPGYLYVRSRAISSRTNDNFDNFPAEEITKGWQSFIGKPVFVNHHNEDHRRARGVIIDAALHTDRLASGESDTWVEVLMEVDAVRFPVLAEAIIKGDIERTSMGTDVEFSVCSVCNNKATSPVEYCKHIPKMKGMKVERVTASGEKEKVLVYEKCYGLSFFENSLLVEDPADPTAYFLGVDDRGLAMSASRQAAVEGESRPNYPRRGSRQVTKVASRKQALVTGDQFPCVVCGQPAAVGVDVVGPNGREEFGLCAQHEAEYEFPEELQTFVWRAASRKQGYGETVAPASVDTLRDEFCPVCGESDSFDGNTCKVCQYIAPPGEFLDPDLEKAQEIDLRQEQEAEVVEDGLAGDEIGEEGVDAEDVPELPEGVNPDEEAVLDLNEVDVDAEIDSLEGDVVDDVADESDPEKEVPGDEEQDESDPQDSGDDTDDEEDEDDEEGSSDSPPFLKKKKKSRLNGRVSTGGNLTMSATLKILARQEQEIRELRSALAFVVKLAGVENHPRVAKLVRKAEENPANAGWATEENPASEAPAFTSEETLGDVDNEAVGGGNATDDVEAIGATSESDASPDAQTDLTSTETVLDEPLDLNEQDVEAPVAGTEDLDEGPRGQGGSGRTETEVRIGDPNNPEHAYSDGTWAEGSKKSEGRFLAALRLARLQIQAGIARGEDLVVANSIAHGGMSDALIQHDIETLTKTIQASKRTATRRVPRNLVPQSKVQAQRTVPSLASAPEVPIQMVASGPSDDEFLFE